MSHNFYKKFIPTILIITLLAQSLFFLSPRQAKAIFPVEDVIAETELMIANISLGTLVGQQTAQNLKTFTLDGLAWMLAKMIVQQITVSTVNWINSGFEGSPAFVQNPGSFFLDVADQATGQFLTGGLLADMCSPFSIDIRIALSFKYHPYAPKRYACTLSTIIKNSISAGKNASINGFTAGDFKQGGWPAFVSMTTEPQNNVYGAYLQAESDLSFRVASAQGQKKDELGAGRGFLSKEVCEDVPVDGDASFIGPSQGNTNPDNIVGSDYVGPINSSGGQVQRQKGCKIVTPGSVIAGTLDTQLASAGHSLELADSINEIVGALFAQLVTKVLQGGLGGASGKGTGDSNSYINKVRDEIKGSSEQVNSLKTQLSNQLDAMIQPSADYIKYKEASRDILLSVKNTFDQARNCYVQKKAGLETIVGTNRNIIKIQDFQRQISVIDSTVSSRITPKLTRIIDEADSASIFSMKMNEVRVAINSAVTLNDLNEPASYLSRTSTINQTATAGDKTQAAKSEYDATYSEAGELSRIAQNMLGKCIAESGTTYVPTNNSQGSNTNYAMPEVSIWATPNPVTLNSTTVLNWTSTSTDSCTITNNSNPFTENWNTVSGTGITSPITTSTTFTAECVGNASTNHSRVSSSIVVSVSN